MAVTEQELLEEQEEILEEVAEIKREVKGRSVLGSAFLAALAGAVVAVSWKHRRGLAGLGKSVVTRG